MIRKLAGVAIGAAMAMAGCQDRTPATRQGSEPEPIDVGVRPYLTNAPLYIAADEGYFEDAGLVVRFQGIPRSTTAYLTTVDRGDLEVIAATSSAGLFNLIARDGQVRVVADKGRLARDWCSPNGIVAGRGVFDAGAIGSPEALAGHRIDVNAANGRGYYVERFLQRAGLSLDDVEIHHLPEPARLDALDSGAVDAMATSEPWLSRILDRGHVMFMPANEIIPEFQWGLLVFGTRLLDDDPDSGRRFLEAYLRGVRQYAEGKTPRNMEILEHRTGLDAETLRRACWPRVGVTGTVDTAGLQAFQEWALSRDLLDRVVPASEYLDTSLLRATRSAGRSP